MTQVVFKSDIFIECVSKRDGSLYLKRIQRRAVCVGANLYEFRYNNQRMYARMVGDRLVCDVTTQWMSTPYRHYTSIAA